MYYGFDVGGTKIEFGAFNEQLERDCHRARTNANGRLFFISEHDC